MPTTHRIWKYGDNVNTDVIFPGKYTYTVNLDPSELAKHALEDLDPTFAQNVQAGDVVIGGRNWGNGSSREQAVTCLIHAGVKAVIATSFARIYYRNAINNGLLVIQCPELVPIVETGQSVSIDIENSVVMHDGVAYTFPRLPDVVQNIVLAGGIIPYLQNQT